jgi:hypothetical protein
MSKQVAIQVRVSEAEKAEWVKGADAAGVSLSEWMRLRLNMPVVGCPAPVSAGVFSGDLDAPTKAKLEAAKAKLDAVVASVPPVGNEPTDPWGMATRPGTAGVGLAGMLSQVPVHAAVKPPSKREEAAMDLSRVETAKRGTP